MTPYAALRQAIQRRSGTATAWEVRRELAAYMKTQEPSMRTWGKKFWAEVMTREEYQALCNRRKKRKPRKKQGEFVYQNIDDQQMVYKEPWLEQLDSDWVADVDAFAKKQQEEADKDAYHAEF